MFIGLFVAGAVHVYKSVSRTRITVASNGLANPMVSLIEDGIAGVTTLLAIVFPWVGLAFAIPAGIGLGWIYRKTSGPNDLIKQSAQPTDGVVVLAETPAGRKPKRAVGRRTRSVAAPAVQRKHPMPKLEFKDYYEALGVDRSADDAALKTAFRKAARKYHPMSIPAISTAEERFKEVNEAYEVLSDADKRKLYDRYGDEWQRYKDAGYTGDEPKGGPRRAQSDDFGSWFTGSSGGSSSPDFGSSRRSFRFLRHALRQLWRWPAHFGHLHPGDPRPRRGQDIDAEVEVTFDEAFRGTTRRFDIQAEEVCPTCNGTGLVRNAICPTCDGAGYIPRIKTIEVKIPAGVSQWLSHSGRRSGRRWRRRWPERRRLSDRRRSRTTSGLSAKATTCAPRWRCRSSPRCWAERLKSRHRPGASSSPFRRDPARQEFPPARPGNAQVEIQVRRAWRSCLPERTSCFPPI